MRILKFVLGLLIVFQSITSVTMPVAGLSSGVSFSQIVAGEEGAASSEFVTLRNTSSNDIDITGWCLSGKLADKFACFTGVQNVRLWLPAHGTAVLVSAPYAQAHPASGSVQYDVIYSPVRADRGSITGSSDTLQLIDAANVKVNEFAWGPDAATSLAGGEGWVRSQDTGMFSKMTDLSPGQSNVYEIETAPDVCPNLPGHDAEVPVGYVVDEQGDCVIDSCNNLEGIQIEPPQGYETDGIGHCTRVIVPLQIVEVLPNAEGADTGREFIELFNPTDASVDLDIYRVQTGTAGDKSYTFPEGATIGPNEYKAFYDSELNFTLINTSGQVRLATADGTMVSESPSYADPGDDMAWALIDGAWQYTDRPTPSVVNLPSAPQEPGKGSVTAEPADCAPGKYRHPLTNRCRNIETDAAVVASCDADQYRNPETGRCRKIATAAVVTPCREGQYRSEETNRCRNIEAASSLTPCSEGQERNPDTNRCRTAAAKAVPDAAFAVQPVQEGMQAFIGWWVLGGIGAVALGYAAWEWRREVAAAFRKVSIGRIFKR